MRICILGKAKQLPLPAGIKGDIKLGELVHSDFQGRFRIAVLGGGYYILCFIKHVSRHTWIFVLATKHAKNTLVCWNEYYPWLERITGAHIKTLRIDGGGEYKAEMKAKLVSPGIKTNTTNTYSSQQNGMVERFDLILLDRVHAVIVDTHLAKTVTYLYNLMPNSKCWDITTSGTY